MTTRHTLPGLQIMVGLALATALSGCFRSDQPFLTEANSVAPYAKITFREEHSPQTTTLSRVGSAYTGDTGQGVVTFRFMALDRPNLYVVQASGPGVESRTGDDLVYVVVRIDLTEHRAFTFKSIGYHLDAGPGLRTCGNDICIVDLNACIARCRRFRG